MKNICILLIVSTFFVLCSNAQIVTEFPIAVGSDSAFGGAAAFDGTNYFIPICAGSFKHAQSNITAQFVSQSDSLVGPRISLNGQCARPPLTAFDGINYLLVWNDTSSELYGQIVSPSASLVGSSFHIASHAWVGMGSLIFADTSYLIIYEGSGGLIYGQRLSKSGSLLGGALAISSLPGNLDGGVAFDGTNYLVAWRDNISKIYGQLVTTSGTLVGTNIIIDSGVYSGKGPVTIGYDGTKYLVLFENQISGINHIYGRFVTTSGDIGQKVTICDVGNAFAASIAFSGQNYLIIWNKIVDPVTWYPEGRYFDTSGVPLDSTFVISNPVTNQAVVVFGGGVLFDGTRFFMGIDKARLDTSGGKLQFIGGDVYGAFLPLFSGITNLTVNGANSNFTFASGDSMSWSYNLPLGDSAKIEMWVDVDSNGITDPGTDFIYGSAVQTDGVNMAHSVGDLDGIVNGHIGYGVWEFGVPPAKYIFKVSNATGSAQITGTVTQLNNPAHIISGHVSVPSGYPKQFILVELANDNDPPHKFWDAMTDESGYYTIEMNADTAFNPWRIRILGNYSSALTPSSYDTSFVISDSNYVINLSLIKLSVGVVSQPGTVPASYSLKQNYPNPFNPATTISFSLPSKSFVSLKVYDVLGIEISTLLTEELSAGTYSRQWDAATFPSGVYFYRIEAGTFTDVKKIILMK